MQRLLDPIRSNSALLRQLGSRIEFVQTKVYGAVFNQWQHGSVNHHGDTIFFDRTVRGQLQEIVPGQVEFHTNILSLGR